MQSYHRDNSKRSMTAWEALQAARQEAGLQLDEHGIVVEPDWKVGRQTVEGLIAIANEEASKRWRRITVRGFLAFIVLIMGIATIHINWGIFLGGLIQALIGFSVASGWTSRRQREAVSQLAQINDLRAVGPILDALLVKGSLERVTVRPLIRLLPHLQTSDCYVLNTSRRTCLTRLLTATKDQALALAILKAYEQIGTEAELAAVERLADGKGLAKKKRDVQQAAQACLSYLRVRVEAQRAQQTLLRASSATGTPADVLLRPASGVVETPPDQLLRPTSTETA